MLFSTNQGFFSNQLQSKVSKLTFALRLFGLFTKVKNELLCFNMTFFLLFRKIANAAMLSNYEVR